VWNWSRGSIGFVGEVFEVMTQVELGLTNVSRFDSADLIISVNDANYKPGASHGRSQRWSGRLLSRPGQAAQETNRVVNIGWRGIMFANQRWEHMLL
jgi:hypothetical protein